MPHALHFLVLALAGWVTRHQEDRIDYRREENRVLREHRGPRPFHGPHPSPVGAGERVWLRRRCGGNSGGSRSAPRPPDRRCATPCVSTGWGCRCGGRPAGYRSRGAPTPLIGRLKRFSNRPCTTWGGRGTSARTDAGGPMRASSMDLRERALLDSDAGMTAADVAAKYRVSGSWVRLVKQRRRETGEVAPRVQRHGRRGMLEPHLHTLADLIAAHPGRTLAELKDALATPARVPTVWRAVRALGLTVKKNGPPVRTRSACRRGRAGRVARGGADLGRRPPRVSGRNRHHQQSASAVRSGTARRARPRPRPRRALADQHVARRVAGHGADRTGGLRRRDRWRELPRLHRTDPGADPAARRHRHRRQSRGPQGRRHPTRHPGRRGTLWYLPPYRPDLNPIELCFAKLKALVRTARCRSSETLWPFLGTCLEHFSPDECRNYFRHCGYSVATRS